ncbi:MAG: phosphatase PAP2 family protein [Flavobacteriaceae bacterium]
MVEQLLVWDTSLFLWLNQMGSSFYDPFWVLMSEKATNVVVYLTLVFIYGRKRGLRAAVLLLFVGVVLVGLTDQLTNIFKDGFMRLRPCHTSDLDGIMRLVKASCGGKYSFFSGHSSNSFALAFFFSLIFKEVKRLMPMLLFLASLIAYSRVYLGVHYPLDIVCGAIAGIGMATLVYSLVNKRVPHLLPPY